MISQSSSPKHCLQSAFYFKVANGTTSLLAWLKAVYLSSVDKIILVCILDTQMMEQL